MLPIEIIDGNFSVCKLHNRADAENSGTFRFLCETDKECSLVCRTEYAPAETAAREDGWKMFRVAETLDFSLVGILAEISTRLAAGKIGIFAVSTYDTDYILTKERDFDRALQILTDSGYRILK